MSQPGRTTRLRPSATRRGDRVGGSRPSRWRSPSAGSSPSDCRARRQPAHRVGCGRRTRHRCRRGGLLAARRAPAARTSRPGRHADRPARTAGERLSAARQGGGAVLQRRRVPGPVHVARAGRARGRPGPRGGRQGRRVPLRQREPAAPGRRRRRRVDRRPRAGRHRQLGLRHRDPRPARQGSRQLPRPDQRRPEDPRGRARDRAVLHRPQRQPGGARAVRYRLGQHRAVRARHGADGRRPAALRLPEPGGRADRERERRLGRPQQRRHPP